MASVMERTMEWVDLTVDLLRSPSAQFPTEVVGTHLLSTFHVDVAALSERRADGAVAMTAITRPGVNHGGLGPEAATALMLSASNSRLLRCHPLVRWAFITGGSAPQSLSRVPKAVSVTDRLGEVIDLLHTVGADQELGVPLMLGGGRYLVFSLNRPGSEDFSDEDILTATHLQPLLMALRRQAYVLEPLSPGSAIHAYELTGREMAVLALLATGRTSAAIGRALGCSARTVEK